MAIQTSRPQPFGTILTGLRTLFIVSFFPAALPPRSWESTSPLFYFSPGCDRRPAPSAFRPLSVRNQRLRGSFRGGPEIVNLDDEPAQFKPPGLCEARNRGRVPAFRSVHG